MSETLTTSQVQKLRRYARRNAARQALSRWGIQPVGRDIQTGEKLWPADQVHAAILAMPGKGHRTDLARKEPNDE